MTPARGAESLMNASVLLLAVLACAAPPSGDPTPARVALTVGEVDSLRRARDFFELRDRLHAGSDTAGVAGRLARTIVAHAFNRPEESSAVITALRTDPALPDSLRWWLMQLEVSNHVRRHRYSAALRSADVARPRPMVWRGLMRSRRQKISGGCSGRSPAFRHRKSTPPGPPRCRCATAGSPSR